MIFVCPNATLSIETLCDIPSSSTPTELGNILTILIEPIFGNVNLLYELVARRSAAEVVIGWRLVFTYCLLYNR